MPDAPYHQIQHQRNREYEEAFTSAEVQQWIALMTPEERALAESEGLLSPHLEASQARGVGREDDASHMAVTAAATHEDPPLEDMPRLILEDALRAVASIFIASKNAKLDIIALCFATGSSACSLWDGNQAEAARSLGLQRMNLNKAIKKWQRAFLLPCNNFTRPAAVSKKLSNAQKAGHWRHAKFTVTSTL